MSFLGCFGLGISTGIMMNFRFMQSHGTLCFSHPNQIQGTFYLFFSTATHQRGVSTSSLSCVPSLCHHINLALSLFLNRRFKHGIIGEYHMTFTETLFRGRPPRQKIMQAFHEFVRTSVSIVHPLPIHLHFKEIDLNSLHVSNK